MFNCAGCKQTLPKKEFISCSKCKLKYDMQCANLTSKEFNQLDPQLKSVWKCPECRSKEPKTDNTNTPVRSTTNVSCSKLSCNDSIEPSNITLRKKHSKSSPEATSERYITVETLRDVLKQELANTIKTLVSTQLNNINDQIAGFCDSLTFINVQYEELKNLLQEKTTIIDQLKKDNEILKSTVRDLSNRLNTVEMHMRENNVEINGIPENKSENLISTVVQLAQTVKSPLTSDDIQQVTRVAKINNSSDRPRSVIVKLQSPRQRDTLLSAVAQFNKKNTQDKLSSQHLGIGGARRAVYVSEHLTPLMKALHAATRIKAKELNYRFVWVRNGRIYIRKDEFSQAKVIKSLEHLNTIQ